MKKQRYKLLDDIAEASMLLRKYQEEQKYNPHNQQLGKKILHYQTKIQRLRKEYNQLFDKELQQSKRL